MISSHYHNQLDILSSLAPLWQGERQSLPRQEKDFASLSNFHLGGIGASLRLFDRLEPYKKAFDGGAKRQSTIPRLLDIGTGFAATARLANRRYGYQVIGIDFQSEYLRVARNLGLALVGGRDECPQLPHLLAARGEQLPFRSASFDVAISQHVTMNFGDLAAVFSQIVSILGEGGCYGFYEVVLNPEITIAELPLPLPFASELSHARLGHWDRFITCLETAGLRLIHQEDETELAQAWLSQAINANAPLRGSANPSSSNNPLYPISPNLAALFPHGQFEQMRQNLYQALADGKIQVKLGIAQRAH